MSFVDLAIPFFINPSNGKPVYSGSIYIGEPDTDPEIAANQKAIRLRQEDGTEVVSAQPVQTSIGGVPLYNGSPVQIIVDGNYSLKVLDHLGAQVYYVPSGSDLTALGSLVPQIDTQTATEGQTFFTLKTGMTYTVGGNDIAIFIDGRRQHPSAYTESSEATITFSEGLSAGQEVMFISHQVEASLSDIQGSATPETGKAVIWDGFQQRSTEADFNSVASLANTSGKYAGKPGWPTDAVSPLPVWASGAAAADVWIDAAGNTVYTPV